MNITDDRTFEHFKKIISHIVLSHFAKYISFTNILGKLFFFIFIISSFMKAQKKGSVFPCLTNKTGSIYLCLSVGTMFFPKAYSLKRSFDLKDFSV